MAPTALTAGHKGLRFQARAPVHRRRCRAQAAATAEDASAASSTSQDCLMLRALRGEDVDRSPVWMMRQAGRYMKVYQDLCKEHKTFRDRSENVDVSVEVTLQPWHAFKPDGVVLFSDILTPLTGMGIPFDIVTGKGPIIENPVRTLADVAAVKTLDAEGATPYVGGALRQVAAAVGNEAAVLGFAGAPYTLASYIVEGGSSKNYSELKRVAFSEPEVLHALLEKLTENVTDYLRYQADNGAQVIQVFDSWASHLSPQDFDTFAAPYTTRILEDFRKTHPHVPTILYISGSGGLLERMAACKPDCLSIDGSVDLKDAINRCGTDFAYQGNIDPGCLFGSKEFIESRIRETVKTARDAGVRHVLNLGHGVLPTTKEENVEHYFKVARELKYSDL